jgi:hypothetical protein
MLHIMHDVKILRFKQYEFATKRNLPEVKNDLWQKVSNAEMTLYGCSPHAKNTKDTMWRRNKTFVNKSYELIHYSDKCLQ